MGEAHREYGLRRLTGADASVAGRGVLGVLILLAGDRMRLGGIAGTCPIRPSPAAVPRPTLDKVSIPTFTLNNGVTMPVLGFGVYQTPPEETTAAVETALQIGYRHVDTAAVYGNERGVGEAIDRSGLARDEVFLETKVWITDFGYDATLHAFDKAIGKLGVEYLDLLILHQALPGEFELTIGAYRALEKLNADGKVRAIGVSNVMPSHLDQLLAETEVVPASTRSKSTRTSASPRCSRSIPRMASSIRRGRRSAVSRSTGRARIPRRSTTP